MTAELQDEASPALRDGVAPSGAPSPSNGPVTRRETALPRVFRRVLALDDLEPLAQRRLPRPIFGYIAGAAETNASFEDNRRAFAEYGFLPQVLRDVSMRSQRARLFGEEWDSPFGVAPMGMSALAAYRGDIALAEAAAEAHIPMVVSGSALVRLEDVLSVNPRVWFQAYLPGDAGRVDALIDRVAGAGVETLMITADVPVRANRENNVRAGFTTPLRPSLRLAWDGAIRPRWTVGVALRTMLRHGVPHFENSFATRGAPIIARHVERDFTMRDHLNWSHIDAIRRRWRGRLLVKGVLHPADAAQARACGADGIIVSNHGGRQLDGAVSPLRALEAIREEAGEMAVALDGGVRRGGDVLKALALGADFVFVGRPFLYAASLGRRAGVGHAIAILREEIDRNMGLLGVERLSELSKAHLFRLP